MKNYLVTLSALALLFSCTLDNNSKKEESGMKAVDLGLSVKWATCNLGASRPEDYGNYYAWGETKTKRNYGYKTYKFCKMSEDALTRYNTEPDYGEVDDKTVLDLEDDVAHVKLGGNWRMPTFAECRELINNCTWERIQINGVNGFNVTGPNGASIFLPAAGYREGHLFAAGDDGHYWSSSLSWELPNNAYFFSFYSSFFGSGLPKVDNGQSNRHYGYTVRPVLAEQKKANKKAEVRTKKETVKIGVDLGLSVRWANSNLGAEKPEDYGDYYAWGETETKDNYDWSAYKFGTRNSGPFSKYNTMESYGEVDNKTVLDLEDDVVSVKLGGTWRIPTWEELEELINNCTWEWTWMHGVNGYLVTGSNGNSIFLPAAGSKDFAGICGEGTGGVYWSSSLNPDYPCNAGGFFFPSSGVSLNIYNSRNDGLSVRPVTE